MHINKKHILKHLLSWLWSLIPLIGIIDWISPSERNKFIILILAFSAFIIVAFQNKQIDKKWLLTVCILLILFLFFQIDKNFAILNTIYLIIISFLVSYPVLFGNLYIYPYKFIFYLFGIYISLGSFFGIISVKEFFHHSSSNMLSVLGIFMAVTINLIEIVQKKTPSLLPSLIALSISIFGISRSGLITSLIYFVSFYLLLYWTKDIKYKMIFAFLMAVLIYFTFQNLDFIRTMDFYTKLEKTELGLSGRDLLWNEYLQNINFTTFLLGYDYTKNALISSFNNNPHNSWISFHASMGVFSIYIMLTLLLSLFHFFHNNKFIFILLLAVILRSLTDTILFFGKFDYIIIIFCFHILDPRFKNKLT